LYDPPIGALGGRLESNKENEGIFIKLIVGKKQEDFLLYGIL